MPSLGRSVRIHVGQSAVSATLRRGSATVWHAARDLAGSGANAAIGVPEAVTDLLRCAPRRRWLPLPPVVVAVDAHAARVKRLRGLPATADGRTLDAVIRENAHQFFLSRSPFVTTSVRRLNGDEVAGGIVDAAIVDAVVAACAATGYPLRAVHPEADPALMIRPVRPPIALRPVPLARTVVAVAACGVAIGAVLIVPGWAAERSARLAGRELAVLQPVEQRVLAAVQERQRVTDELVAVARFERRRRSATELLAALTHALPASAALVDVRIDTAGAELVVLSTRVADVLRSIAETPGVVAPELVGAVQHTVSDGRELERATLRFRYDAPVVQDTLRLAYPSPRELAR